MKKISFINLEQQKEIVVWIRLQEGMDKYEILDFIVDKFGLDDEHAEALYYKALPNGLTFNQETQVKELSEDLQNNNTSVQEVNEVLDTCADVVLETCDNQERIIEEFLELAQQCLTST